MRANIPVPPHERAPAGHRWLWYIGPPAMITMAWRLIPARLRSTGRGSNSHAALAAILAGGGWAAFFRYAIPRITLSDGIPWWLDGRP